MTMCRLTILLIAVLFVAFVNGRPRPNFKDPGNLSKILKGLYGKTKDQIHTAGAPIEPSVVINLLLKYYCELLREQGVTNLPDYCYTPEMESYHRDRLPNTLKENVA